VNRKLVPVFLIAILALSFIPFSKAENPTSISYTSLNDDVGITDSINTTGLTSIKLDLSTLNFETTADIQIYFVANEWQEGFELDIWGEGLEDEGTHYYAPQIFNATGGTAIYLDTPVPTPFPSNITFTLNPFKMYWEGELILFDPQSEYWFESGLHPDTIFVIGSPVGEDPNDFTSGAIAITYNGETAPVSITLNGEVGLDLSTATEKNMTKELVSSVALDFSALLTTSGLIFLTANDAVGIAIALAIIAIAISVSFVVAFTMRSRKDV
jgi:hypothetical protein